MAYSYSVSINDPSSFEKDTALLTVVRAAASEWSRYISGFGSLDIQIDVGPTTRANASVATAVNLSFDNSISLVELGTVNELRTGIDSNGVMPDLTINVDPDFLQTLWFDPTKLTAIPSDKVDGLSVFMHEIGHGLGFLGYRSPIDGRLAGYETPWDRLITLNIDGSATFNGAYASAIYGNLVPITTLQNGEQYNHLGNDVAESAGHDLMNGVAFYYGQRYSISDLDLAILKDIGLSISAIVGDDSYLSNGSEGRSSTLILRVSEDAYQGDPHFTVTVDGKQVGGTLTTSASHAAGQTQDITLTGNFGSGDRALAVKIIDNADNGWGNDRNVYVQQVTLHGQT
ncbi:hypothetical protein MKK70_19535 [Methylobacterium sp. E-041]|uniref:carbohydrate-binding domain-containing protein n=1 Tax=Methylobacterium sp. E-041 TaxID=2836573 RepID=UPI001FB879DD|nr:carbohydrate-binding domain-containing protein [Methylobacterium sp. E-041]MCJ2107535.1 hypothetical protein [Methylobacterium sp. E-041]